MPNPERDELCTGRQRGIPSASSGTQGIPGGERRLYTMKTTDFQTLYCNKYGQRIQTFIQTFVYDGPVPPPYAQVWKHASDRAHGSGAKKAERPSSVVNADPHGPNRVPVPVTHGRVPGSNSE